MMTVEGAHCGSWVLLTALSEAAHTTNITHDDSRGRALWELGSTDSAL
jgi:hypothetical protein